MVFTMCMQLIRAAFYVVGQYDTCDSRIDDKFLVYRISVICKYWIIILRDVVLVLITVYFSRKVALGQKLAIKNTEQDDASAFMDFEMMLISVLPHKYFAVYL